MVLSWKALIDNEWQWENNTIKQSRTVRLSCDLIYREKNINDFLK